jgi:hypothetical protein
MTSGQAQPASNGQEPNDKEIQSKEAAPGCLNIMLVWAIALELTGVVNAVYLSRVVSEPMKNNGPIPENITVGSNIGRVIVIFFVFLGIASVIVPKLSAQISKSLNTSWMSGRKFPLAHITSRCFLPSVVSFLAVMAICFYSLFLWVLLPVFAIINSLDTWGSPALGKTIIDWQIVPQVMEDGSWGLCISGFFFLLSVLFYPQRNLASLSTQSPD